MSTQDESMTDAGREPTQPTMDLSQHSLWSEQVGDVPMMHTSSVRFAKPVAVLESQPEEPDEEIQRLADAIARVKDERAAKASSSGQDSDASVDDASGDEESSEPASINLNPKARKTGRPKTNVNQRALQKKIVRAQSKARDKVQRKHGIVTLEDVVRSIQDAQPDVHEAARILAGVTVKFKECARKKSKFSLMKNPVLNKEALLSACIAAFPANTAETPVVIDDSGAVIQLSHPSGKVLS